ncbi:MAG: hypothetical protein ACFWT6_00420 [Virgibacillus proomii]|jgi:hypothetical protein
MGVITLVERLTKKSIRNKHDVYLYFADPGAP